MWTVIVFNRDGTYETHDSDKSQKPPCIGDFVVNDKWIDSEGNICYKYYASYPVRGGHKYGGEGYWLTRITDSGKTLESVYSAIEYPEQISSNSLKHTYVIFYRE